VVHFTLDHFDQRLCAISEAAPIHDQMWSSTQSKICCLHRIHICFAIAIKGPIPIGSHYYQAILAISRCVQGTSVREPESLNTDRNTLARKRVLHITDSIGFHSIPCCSLSHAFPDNSHAGAAYLQVPRFLRGLNLDVPVIPIIEMLVRGSQL